MSWKPRRTMRPEAERGVHELALAGRQRRLEEREVGAIDEAVRVEEHEPFHWRPSVAARLTPRTASPADAPTSNARTCEVRCELPEERVGRPPQEPLKQQEQRAPDGQDHPDGKEQGGQRDALIGRRGHYLIGDQRRSLALSRVPILPVTRPRPGQASPPVPAAAASPMLAPLTPRPVKASRRPRTPQERRGRVVEASSVLGGLVLVRPHRRHRRRRGT